jgi:hypothetical protein
MAVTSKQVTQTASAVQCAPLGTYARSIVFQNNASNNMRLADANVTTTRGILILAVGSYFAPPPAESGAHLDLGQWWTIGTNADKLDIVYDAMN